MFISQPINQSVKTQGFTLMEVLIALFIFTILSVMLVSALRTVISSEAGTERNAQRLRELQMSLLVFSRDVEQMVDRPILNTAGKEEAAFVGSPQAFTGTQVGFANPLDSGAHSALQRSGYSYQNGTLSRVSWNVLDQATTTTPHQRRLLENLTDVHFEYLDNKGHFQPNWPIQSDKAQTLPRAIRIFITIPNWGTISQLYVISAQPIQKNNASPTA